MLVLTRKLNESIVIPEYGISIMVVDIKGHQIKLGVIAPKAVKIFRQEVLDAASRKEDRSQSFRDTYEGAD